MVPAVFRLLQMPVDCPGAGDLAQGSLAFGDGAFVCLGICVPHADGLIPVRPDQAFAVEAERHPRVESRVPMALGSPLQGEDFMTRADIPHLNYVTADAGQTLAVGTEG